MGIVNFFKDFFRTGNLIAFLCILMIVSAMFVALPRTALALSSVQIDLSTNNDSYYDMQTVGLYANLASDGTPVTDGVMAVEVDRPSLSWYPIIFRSVKGNQNPNPALFNDDLEILSIIPVNINWVPQTSFKRDGQSYFNVTLRNTGLGKIGLITASIFDLTAVPLSAASYGARGSPMFISQGITILRFSMDIPTWATLGTATVYINIFSESPSIYGAHPMVPEKSTTFQIKSSFGPSMTIENYPNDGGVSTSIGGVYNFSWRVPPFAVLGDYVAYAAANYTDATPNFDSAAFQVIASSTPPQASFTYSPTTPYAGGTTYFDASSSFSYNGTITNYRWVWGDGSPPDSTIYPFITHVFGNNGTFLVTLNVTDSQELWCTSQKPVYVSGPTPPVAAFTFTPNPTWRSANTTFDASA